MQINTANIRKGANHSNRLVVGIAAKSKTLALTLSIGAALCSVTSLAKSETTRTLETPLVPFSATYSVGNNSVQAGNARVVLEQRSENEWAYSLNTKPTGLFKLAGKGYVSETSNFTIVNKNNQSILQPNTYKYRQDNEKKRAVDATFNWGQRQLYFSRGEENKQTAISTETLDRMTMTLTMMSTLNEDFDSTTLEVFDGGRIKQLQLLNEGTEILSTRLGTLDTVRVKTSNIESSRRVTLTWFAPALNNLPVRIEQHKEGKLVARLSVSEYAQN